MFNKLALKDYLEWFTYVCHCCFFKLEPTQNEVLC
jgi:hypothetical protein